MSLGDDCAETGPFLNADWWVFWTSDAAQALSSLPHKESHMTTNLAIDPDLPDRTVQVSSERTEQAVVTKALQEFIARCERRRVADLFGQLAWDPSFDYKAERSRRTQGTRNAAHGAPLTLRSAGSPPTSP